MGIIRPPWISKAWFKKFPFNYCDHFGDKKLLSQLCKICHDEIIENDQLRKMGKDPYDWGVVFERVGASLGKTMALVQQEAERLGIDLDNLPEEDEDPYNPETEPIYKLVVKYGDAVEKIIRDLEVVPIDTDLVLLEKGVNALSHSRTYVIAKIGRALQSKQEERFDTIMQDLADSKTAALFAYVAIQRNCRVLLALVKHKPLADLREKHLKFAKLSLKTSEIIKQEFFPLEDLVYEEFGYSDF